MLKCLSFRCLASPWDWKSWTLWQDCKYWIWNPEIDEKRFLKCVIIIIPFFDTILRDLIIRQGPWDRCVCFWCFDAFHQSVSHSDSHLFHWYILTILFWKVICQHETQSSHNTTQVWRSQWGLWCWVDQSQWTSSTECINHCFRLHYTVIHTQRCFHSQTRLQATHRDMGDCCGCINGSTPPSCRIIRNSRWCCDYVQPQQHCTSVSQ